MLRLGRYHGDRLRNAAIISIGPNAYRRPGGIAVVQASLLIRLITTFLITVVVVVIVVIVVPV